MSRPTSTPTELLASIWGYSSFRGQQEGVIDAVLDGKDALVLFPTGRGKSICFQIPALMLGGLTVVVSPLVALMRDQVDDLKAIGITAGCLYSGQPEDEGAATRRQLSTRSLKILYLTPERVVLPTFAATLHGNQIALLVIDECHCVVSWGNNFRKDYLSLNRLKTLYPGVPRLALTATADPHTREEIVRLLDLNDAEVFVDSFDRPNISYEISERSNGRQQLLDFLARHAGESGIVYCLSRKKVEETSAWLNEKGIRARAYHAGMDSALRQDTQDAFRLEEGLCLVATVAFGMGINKPNVRYVAHLDLPASVEGYYQETGRAGRDGLPSEAFMTYGMQDIIQRQRMIEEGESTDDVKRVERSKLNALVAICETVGCRRRAILSHFGEAYHQDCGNCDTCKDPVQQWDGTDAAIKALAAVYRTGQRFGAGHLIDVLVGKVTERTASFGHTDLAVFGVGKDIPAGTWHSVFRQLLAFNLIEVDHSNFGSIRLLDGASDVFKRRTTVMFRKEQTIAARKTRAAGKANIRQSSGLSEAENDLFQRMRELRLAIAKEQSLAPYMIFPDTTLIAFAKERPATKGEMLKISGVGETKLQRYGDRFLAVTSTAQVR